MDDYRFKHMMREKLADEYLAGAAWVLQMLSQRAQTKAPNSPEQLELLRAKNTIQGQMGARRKALMDDYRERGI
jgi:hypothetical protein